MRALILLLPLCLLISTASIRTQAQDGPIIGIDTELGRIDVALDVSRAPATVANFLRYADSAWYDGGSFFRTVTMQNQPNDSIRIMVIQGGVTADHQDGGWAPIHLEDTRTTGLRHLDGTISMARSSPHSATWSFFICVGDQPELDFGGKRNPDGQGFAAFGRVVKGMDVVRRINASPAVGQSLKPPIRIDRISRVQDHR